VIIRAVVFSSHIVADLTFFFYFINIITSMIRINDIQAITMMIYVCIILYAYMVHNVFVPIIIIIDLYYYNVLSVLLRNTSPPHNDSVRFLYVRRPDVYIIIIIITLYTAINTRLWRCTK